MLAFPFEGGPVLHEYRVFCRNARFLIGNIRLREHFSSARNTSAGPLVRGAGRLPEGQHRAPRRGAAEAWKRPLKALAAKDFPEFLQPVIEWPSQRTFGEHGGGLGAPPGRHGANFGRARGSRLRRKRLNR
jgi:hypothetical protein